VSFTDYEVPEENPTDGGQVDAVDGADAGFDGPVLQVDEYADYKVPVRVDGQEMFVPLAEAVQGYQRQADYTRKTQEVAQQRQELQVVAAIKQALDNDPEGTLQALSEHYGVGVAPRGAQPAAVEDPYSDWGFDGTTSAPDPRLSQLEQRIALFEKAQAQQQLEAEISRLQTKYGDSFNAQEVLAQAVASGDSDLERVYKLIDYDRVASTSKAQQQVASKTQQAVAAKKAAQVVSSGGSAVTQAMTDGPIRSIRDAWAAAKAQHGV
jgi:hypothetical protein